MELVKSTGACRIRQGFAEYARSYEEDKGSEVEYGENISTLSATCSGHGPRQKRLQDKDVDLLDSQNILSFYPLFLLTFLHIRDKALTHLNGKALRTSPKLHTAPSPTRQGLRIARVFLQTHLSLGLLQSNTGCLQRTSPPGLSFKFYLPRQQSFFMNCQHP